MRVPTPSAISGITFFSRHRRIALSRIAAVHQPAQSLTGRLPTFSEYLPAAVLSVNARRQILASFAAAAQCAGPAPADAKTHVSSACRKLSRNQADASRRPTAASEAMRIAGVRFHQRGADGADSRDSRQMLGIFFSLHGLLPILQLSERRIRDLLGALVQAGGRMFGKALHALARWNPMLLKNRANPTARLNSNRLTAWASAHQEPLIPLRRLRPNMANICQEEQIRKRASRRSFLCRAARSAFASAGSARRELCPRTAIRVAFSREPLQDSVETEAGGSRLSLIDARPFSRGTCRGH